MGYHHVPQDAVESVPEREVDVRPICGSASEDRPFRTLGLRMYIAKPGEQLPSSYHYHHTQEEAFYVIKGPLYVETPEREYKIPSGDIFLVESGNPHRAFNPDDAETPIQVLAIGAPTGESGIPYEPQ